MVAASHSGGQFLLRAKGFDAHNYLQPVSRANVPTGTFDTIVCFYVLNVLFPDEQTAVLMDISRLLKTQRTGLFFRYVGTLAATVSERISYTASRFISAT